MTPNSVPGEIEEIVIRQSASKRKIFCYNETNPENQGYGWCWTNSNYYDLHRPKQNYRGWGFCGRECYLSDDEPQYGVLREKMGVAIFPDPLCREFLQKSLERTVQVMPDILCIGRLEKWRESVWQKTKGGIQPTG